MLELNLCFFGGRGVSSGIKNSQSYGKNKIEYNLQFFARKASGRKVHRDDSLWDSFAMGDRKWQKEQGVFDWQFGGYRYIIEYDDDYDYKIIDKRKMGDIYEKKRRKRKR